MQEHITEKISAYLDRELPKDERQQIAEHLLQCENCRSEHDEIKLGATFAAHLTRADAPDSVWSEIENALAKQTKKQAVLIPHFSFFSPRNLTLAAAILLIGFGFIAAFYLGVFVNKSPEIVKTEPRAIQTTNVEAPESVSAAEVVTPNLNTNSQISSVVGSHVKIEPLKTDSNAKILPETNSNQKLNKPEIITAQNNALSWSVETLSGAPTAGNRVISENGKLAVGQFLETDANSRARVQVANIGQVEIAPNSRVQLVKTHPTEHRLSLTRGVLQAKILAPPRLFIVDTPAAVAVDLGCEYTLEVDNEGNSKLHVTSGYVALEKDGRESIVPAGAICFTKSGKNLGTPFSADASEAFQTALARFDFQKGGSDALELIIKESTFYDAVSLWHLLSRTQNADREKVFDALSAHVKPTADTTRAGILRLDKKMLDRWWAEIERLWFE